MSRVQFCRVALFFIYISKTTDKIRDSPVHRYSIGVRRLFVQYSVGVWYLNPLSFHRFSSKSVGKDSDGTKMIGLCLCYFKSDQSPLVSAGVRWTLVDSRQNKGGRVKSSFISPVRFFEVLGLWWTSLGLGLSPWRSKTETRPDF